MNQSAKRFRAFLSYSQVDKRRARQLHSALETYRVPKGIDAEGVDPKTRRIGRIFRDDEDMSARESLGAALEGAIEESDTLVVLCSPRAAASKWVDLEVRRYKRRSAGRVFAVILGGTPNSGAPATECFCPALKQKVDKAGELTGELDEPLAPDWRKDGLAKLRVRLVAGLIGVPFGDLWNRDRRRARGRALRTSAATVAGILFLATAMLAVDAGQIRQTSLDRSATLAEAALVATDQGVSPRALRFGVLAAREGLLEQPAAKGEPALARAAQGTIAGVDLQGHQGWMFGAELSSDGRRVVSWAQDWRVKVWDARSGALIFSHDQGAFVAQAKFLAGSSHVVSWGDDGAVTIWDAATGRVIARQDHGAEVRAVEISKDEKRAVSGASNGELKVWSVDDGRLLSKFSNGSYLFGLAFSPDETRVLSWNFDTVFVWDAYTGRLIAKHDQKSANAAFSMDGKRVLSWGVDGNVAVWDAASGQIIAQQKHEDAVEGAAFSPDGGRILSWSRDGRATVWSAATGSLIASRFHPSAHGAGESVEGAEFSPDGTRVLSRPLFGNIRLWDAATGRLIVEQTNQGDMSGGAKFSPDGRRVLTWGDSGNALVWDAGTGALISGVYHDRPVIGAQFSPSGQQVLSWGEDGTARVWDATSGAETARQTHGACRTGPSCLWAEFTSDGEHVLSWSEHSILRLWRSGGDAEIARHSHGSDATGAILSPDGKQILSWGKDGVASFWNAETGMEIAHQNSGRDVRGAILSADGKKVLSWSESGNAVLWRSADGIEIARRSHGDCGFSVQCVGAAISTDGKQVLSWGRDGKVRVWDSVSGADIACAEHGDYAIGAAFSSDNKRVLSWAMDGSIKVWDAVSGGKIVNQTHAGSVQGAFFVDGGAKVFSWDVKGLALLWNAANGAELTHQNFRGEVGGAVLSSKGDRILSWGEDASVHLVAADGTSIVDYAHEMACARGYVCSGGAFSYDGALFVSWADASAAQLRNSADGAKITSISLGANVHLLSPGVTFSADGRRMVIWGGGDTVLVDTTTGAELFRKRDSDIGAVLSRDAGRVLSWDIEGALKLWDVSTGVEIMHLVLPARVWKAEFDPSGDRVLAWNADGTVRIWDVRYAANVRGQQLVADVCSNMLPVTAGQLRRITDADVLAAPILRGHVGDDACTVPSIWSTLWQEAARLISPGGGTVAKN